jgi:predicted TIM-barrel fold metal-dependent hydrolase
VPKIVDVSINFKPHSELGVYKYLGLEQKAGIAWRGDDLVARLDEARIDMGGVIANVVANGVGGEVLGVHVDEVAEQIAPHPDRLFGWVGINPLTTMETLRYIEYGITQVGFKGVHVYPHWFGVPVNDRLYYPIYAKCAELGVPITLQVGTQTMRSGARLCARPSLLDDVAFDFPELKLIGLHIGRPWTFEMVQLATNYENVFILADAHPPRSWEADLLDYIKQSVWSNRDGTEKVMWGTDHPIQEFDPSLNELRGLDLTQEQFDAVAGGNACRILGL